MMKIMIVNVERIAALVLMVVVKMIAVDIFIASCLLPPQMHMY